MKSRHLGPVAKLAGLERSARLAGECFGHEEPLVVPQPASSRLVWWGVALMAAIGLAMLALR